MSTPRITGSSSSSASPLQECETPAVTSPSTGPAPRPQPAPEGHSLEAFRDQSTGWETPVKEQTEGAETSLAALKAERHEQNAAATALREGLEGPLAALASQFSDPTSQEHPFGNCLTGGAFGKAFLQGEVREAVSTLPRETAELLIRNQVTKTWPKLSGEDIDKVTAQMMSVANDVMRPNTAFALRQTAVDAMSAAAKDLAQFAKDPAALQDLAATLIAKSGVRATPQEKQEARALRDSLGLDSPTPLKTTNPAVLAERIGARANLVQEQATKLANTGAMRVATELLGLDVAEPFLRAAKVKEGSWAAEQVGAVKVQGEGDVALLNAVKTATSVSLGVAATVVGFGGVGKALIGAPLSAMDIEMAKRQVDKASAAESAGIMAPGARRHAEAELKAVQASAAFKLVAAPAAEKFLSEAPAALLGKAGGHLMNHVAAHELGEAVMEPVMHTLVDGSLEELSELAVGEAPEGARGLNAAQQANVSMAVRTLHDNPEARVALQAAIDQAGLPNDDAKAQALQGFLASQGRTLSHASADEVGSAFSRYVKSQRAE